MWGCEMLRLQQQQRLGRISAGFDFLASRRHRRRGSVGFAKLHQPPNCTITENVLKIFGQGRGR